MGTQANQMLDGSGIDFLSRKLVGLRAIHWEGRLPSPGDFLRTERGLTAYEIVSVKENTRPDARSRAAFKCWRVPAASVPDGARVHEWRWSSRD
jgi:hypothetical protein